MKTREQLLKTLASLRDGKEYSDTLEVIESSYKDELKKKNNEAKNLRARMLDTEKVNRMVVERYKELVNRLSLDTNMECLNKDLEDSGTIQKINLALQKRLERMQDKCKRQEIDFIAEISKERNRKHNELKRIQLISTLNETKAAYVTALLKLLVSTM
jgi:hypothetical protein